ncbi:MAG: fluoride efflux transporter FluC [Alphaproteobacteria bacterium]
MSWSHISAVALGGVLGALARYAVYHGMRVHVPMGSAALATLLVNTLGCAAMGFCVVALAAKTHVHFFLTVGFLGSFTTFSAFTADMFVMAQHRAMVEVVGFAMVMIGLGAAAFWMGMRLGRL